MAKSVGLEILFFRFALVCKLVAIGYLSWKSYCTYYWERLLSTVRLYFMAF